MLHWPPPIEFLWLKKIDLYPLKPESLESLREICIGTKSRSVGDTLMLSALPRRLKERYPSLRIRTYPRAFNPYVFRGNPYVEGVSYLPDRLYGDDCNWGSGHLIQLKEQFFDLPITPHPKAEIYLSEPEKVWACKFSAPSKKPICGIHPWGKTFSSVADLSFWNSFIKRWQDRLCIWQFGIEGQQILEGCDQVFLFKKSAAESRKLFSLMSVCDLFIGVNSGPMHVARAFEVPGIILTEGENPEKIFKNRAKFPYYLYRNGFHGFLYEENFHIECKNMQTQALTATMDHAVENQLNGN